MEAMMNSGTLVPPATAPTSTRSSRRNAAPVPATAAEEEDKEKRKAEKKRLKEEKKLEKAMLKARMGLQGAAGEDGGDGEGEGQGDDGEVPESPTGGGIGVSVIADESSAPSSKKRKADAAAELPSPSRPEAEAEAETAAEPAGKKSKGKKGKGKAADVGAASASMDDEKLQELANAVLGGSLPITADAGASGIEVRPAYGLSSTSASAGNNDDHTGMDDAQLDIAQRVAGIDDSAIDPALQQLHAIEEADMDAATLWNATRRAMKTAEEGAGAVSASDRARGKANGKGRDAMLVDANAALDDDHAGDHDFLMDGNDESNDPFGHAQAQGGITGLINATLMQQQQQEQEQEDQLGPQQQYGQDSSSFEYALPADAQAHTFGGMSGTVGTSAPTGTAPKSAAVPRKRRKAGDPPARKGRPPNPVGPDGEPLPLGTAGDGAEAGDDAAASGSGSGGAGDQTGFAAPKKQTRVVNTAKGPKDDELVALFQTPGEMERFLAERWLPSQELIRLEHAGILAYKKGKFSVEESEAIAAFAEEFKRLHRIDAHKFADIVVSLGKKPDYPRFWNDIALVVPGRPVRFVQKYVKRVFDPRARQGPWQQDEDKALEQACFANPGQWTKIAAAVGRTEDDCRTRWRDELRHKAERERGRWTKEEEQRLSDIIVRHNLELGKEAHARDAPWESVVKEMGGSRTTMQCRKKWHDQLMPALKKAGGKYILKKKDRPRLIEAISAKKYAREEHVDFQEIAREEFGMDDYHPLRAMYRRIRAKVPDADEPGLVYSARMAEALALNVTASSLNYKSAATVEHVSDDEEEEDDGEGEGDGAANGSGNGSGSRSGKAGSREGSYSRPTLDTVADAVAAAAAAEGGEGEGERAGEQGAIA